MRWWNISFTTFDMSAIFYCKENVSLRSFQIIAFCYFTVSQLFQNWRCRYNMHIWLKREMLHLRNKGLLSCNWVHMFSSLICFCWIMFLQFLCLLVTEPFDSNPQAPLSLSATQNNRKKQTQLQPHILGSDVKGLMKYPVPINLSPGAKETGSTGPATD